MTFDNAAYATDGARISAALARRALYAEARDGGIVQTGDLKVTQLAVPGVGVLIAPGVGLVLNDYQTSPNEVYVASNPGVHTITAGEMPAANPSPKSYIVAVVIGDPEFSQVGHPWMGSDDPPVGEETTFQYVRPTIIEVAAGATTVPGSYPALSLARIDVPADTTTITDSMIHDLRALASPRQSQEIFTSPNGTWENASPVRIASGSTYADWGPAQYAPTVKVPAWATRAILVASINGVRLSDTSVSVSGNVRTQLGSVVGPVTSFDYSIGGGAIRDNLQTAGEYDVSGIAGTTVAMRVEGYQSGPVTPTVNQRLSLQSGSQIIFDVRFFEV